MLIEDATISFKRAVHGVLYPFFMIPGPTVIQVNQRNVVTYPAEIVFDVHDLDVQESTSPIIAFVRGHTHDVGDEKCSGGFVSRTEVVRQVIVRVPDGVNPVDIYGDTMVPKMYADIIYGLVVLAIKTGRAKLSERGVYLPEIEAVATEIIATTKEAQVYGIFKANTETFFVVEKPLSVG